MKNIFRPVMILFFAVWFTNAKASTMLVEHETNPTNNDTSAEVKSNVVIFKLITTPASTPSNHTNSGSLKKAGKVARTSYSHSTSIENIIYKKKGI